MTSRVLKYGSPRLVMCPSRVLPPVEYWRGTRPSQAANCRPFLKSRPLASTRTARDDAETVVREAQRVQLGGRATSLDVIDAQRTLASAEQTLAQLESAISDDQVAVFLALGGGWEVAEDHTEVAHAGASGPQ